MADDLPTGYTLDPPKGGGDLPPGYTLDEPKSIGRAAQDLPRDMQMRADALKRLVAAKGEPGYGTKLVDSFTMGLNRPLGGAVNAIAGEGTAGERYRAGVGAEEDYVKRAERNTNPYLGAATDVIGGLATGGPALGLAKGAASKVAVEAPSTLAKIGRWMMGNTGQGVIEGAARNAESPENAAIGAGVGGAVSGVTGKIVGAGAKLLPGVRGAQKEVNEAVREGGSKGLKEASGEVFDRLDQAGIHFGSKETPALANNVNAVTSGPLPASVRGEIDEVVKDVNRRVQNGAMTFGDVRAIQSDISKLKAHANPDVRRVAGDMSNAVDDFFNKAKPTMPASSVGKVGPTDLADAKDLYRRGSNAAKAEYLGEKGTLTAGDQAKKLRTNFGEEHNRIIDPERFSRFQNNPSQVSQIKGIAEGDPKRAALADFLNKQGGNFTTFGLLGAAGGGGTSYFGDPTGFGAGLGMTGLTSLALGLGGKAGARQLNKTIANRGAARVDDLVRNIVTGSANRDVINTPRDALAKILAAKQLGLGAGRYSSSFFNKE